MNYMPEDAGSGQFGICNKCNKPPTKEGHDGCLGVLQGNVRNACCGHGKNSQAYIQYFDGTRIAGEEAIREQKRLKLTDER